MKKTLFAGLLAVTATIGFLNAPASVEELSMLDIANIQALADGEEESYWEYQDGLTFTYTSNYTIDTNWYGDDKCAFTCIGCKGGGKGCNSRSCPDHG